MGPFQILSLVLQYPDDALRDERDEIAGAARALPPTPANRRLADFVAWWSATPAGELQRAYTRSFDFSRRTSLDLTYYTHGDRRQRGLALLKLRQRYRAAGCEMEGTELPDHLAVLLEFVDVVPDEGGALMAEFRPVIELMRMALERERSPFAGALDALCMTLPELSDDERAELARMAQEGPPTEDVGLEPFAPPEVMPASTHRRTPAACTAEGRTP